MHFLQVCICNHRRGKFSDDGALISGKSICQSNTYYALQAKLPLGSYRHPLDKEINLYISLKICPPSKKRVGGGNYAHNIHIAHLQLLPCHGDRGGQSTPLKNSPLVWNHQLTLKAIFHVKNFGTKK